MNFNTISKIASVSLWWHLAAFIICIAGVYSSLQVGISSNAWIGLSNTDPLRNVKVFSYVLSIYFGVEMSGIRPANAYAYSVRNTIIILRSLFVLNISTYIFSSLANSLNLNSNKTCEDLNKLLHDDLSELEKIDLD
tara:strand:- start:675 stop:1085 length:411 start_codon:yes stop_codon:yes gene_type:complete